MTQPESPSPGYQKALLALWSATAEQTNTKGSRNFMQGHVITRAPELSARAASYDAEERSAICVVATGALTKRAYGIERLRITRAAVDLSRLLSGGVPLLDNHNFNSVTQSLGRVADAWCDRGALMGKIVFNQTALGDMAAGMVERGEIVGVSPGYHVEKWKITDQSGRVLDPQIDRIRSDDDLVYTATRWQLVELSLALVPSDPMAVIRSHTVSLERAVGIGPLAAAEERARPRARQAMVAPAWWRRRPHYRVTRFAT